MREGMSESTKEGIAFSKWVRSNPYTVLLVITFYVCAVIVMFKFAE